MARGRFINKTVATDSKVAKLMELGGPFACLFHHRIIAFLDRNGNVRADEFWLKASIFPRDSAVTPEDCRKFSDQLTECGLTRSYEVDGCQFLNFPGFAKNQINFRPEKEKDECPKFQEQFEVIKKQQVGKITEKLRKGGGKRLPLSESESESESEKETTSPRDFPQAESHTDPPCWMSDIVTQWNQMATELGYPKVSRLTKDRKAHLATRQRELDFDFPKIITAFYEHKPKILSGKNGSEWKPDFDYVIRSEGCYIKILEGKFASNGNSNGKLPGHLGAAGKTESRF